MVEILENVRGKDVFVLQSTCTPTNDNLMELLIMVDALKRASAGRITAAIPYFGYARQDRRPRSARVRDQRQGGGQHAARSPAWTACSRWICTPTRSRGSSTSRWTTSTPAPILLGDVWKHGYENLVVVSPDVGGVVRARALAKRLESDLAIIDKRRPRPNVAEVMNIIGEVEGRTCVIMDDMVDTANTLCGAAEALKEQGADAGARLLHAPGAVGQRGRAHRRTRCSTSWW